MLFANDRMKLVTLISSESLRWKTSSNSVATHNLLTYILYSSRLSTDEFLHQMRFIVSLDFHIFLLKKISDIPFAIFYERSYTYGSTSLTKSYIHTRKLREFFLGHKFCYVTYQKILKKAENRTRNEMKWKKINENLERAICPISENHLIVREIHQNLPLTNHR